MPDGASEWSDGISGMNTFVRRTIGHVLGQQSAAHTKQNAVLPTLLGRNDGSGQGDAQAENAGKGKEHACSSRLCLPNRKVTHTFARTFTLKHLALTWCLDLYMPL